MEIVLGIVAAVELVGIVLLLVMFFNNKRNMSKINQTAAKIAGKDVDFDDLELSAAGSDLKAVAQSLNIIKRNIRGFLEATKNSVITLSDSIDVLSEVVMQNEAGNEETAMSLQVVAGKSDEQLGLVRDNLDLIEANNNQLERIKDNILSIQSALQESVTFCNSGMDNLSSYEQDMNVVSENLKNCTEVLNDFVNQIHEINSIKDLVLEISESLALLSFNASIESARVGELGKGFSIISVEMKKMSDQTREGMDAINAILDRITEIGVNVTDQIRECDDSFEQSVTVFSEIAKTFRNINNQSLDVNEKMTEMSDKYLVIAQNSNESRDKADSLFAASETISDSTRNIAAISEENSAESSRMTENVETLESMLSRFNGIIDQFNTGVRSVKKNRAKRVKIAYFSPLDNFFWFGIRSGVNYAQKELKDRNADIVYYFYKTNAEEVRFPSDVQRCIDDDFDAIIYPGFMHGADREMKEAVKHGVKIFTYNCDCDADIRRTSCYAPDQVEAGMLAAKETAKAIHNKGNVAIVVGERVVALNKDRYDSFVKTMDKYKDIHIVDTVEVLNDPQKTYTSICECIRKHPDLDAIYSTTGMQMQLVKAITDSGKKGKITAVVFDKNQEIFECIHNGIISATIDHDPFTQGYYPIIMMYNHLVDGAPLDPNGISCKVSIVNKENVDQFLNM